MLVLQGLLLLPPPPQLPLLPCFCWTQARSLQAAMKRRRQPEAVPRHSWESAAPSWEADALFESSASEMETELEATGETAGENLVELLLTLYFEGRVSAKTLCVLCWWAHRAGAAGPASNYAFRPGAPSGHYAAHIDRAHGIDLAEKRKGMLTIPIPKYTKYDGGRSEHECPIVVPHEALAAEIEANPSIMHRFRESRDAGEWPPAYTQHERVRASPHDVVLPCALYLDGVPMTRTDGVLGFTFYDLVSQKRHLCAVIRKAEMCTCGCRGWCSLWPIWNALAWSLKALSDGVYPHSDPLGRPWPAGSPRAAKAGTRLPCPAIVVQIKGDWVELTSSVGFANWRTSDNPCFLCKCNDRTMYQMRGIAPGVCHWGSVTKADLQAEWARCEKVVVVSAADHRRLRTSLAYDRSRDGSRGRTLVQNFPALGLTELDRLEPSLQVPNVGALEEWTTFPAATTWWSRRGESRTRHHNPIFDVPGIEPWTCCVDALHTLYLGPCRDWAAAVVWAMIDTLAFAPAGNAEDVKTTTVAHISTLLATWYKVQQSRSPNEPLTQITHLGPTMIGTRHRPMLSTKAAETKDAVPFFVDLLRRRPVRGEHARRAGALLRCGEALVRISEIMKAANRVLDPLEVQGLYDSALTLWRMWEPAGLEYKPKMHLLMEMVRQSPFHGNPSRFWTFEDEGLNRLLSQIGRSAHRLVWELRVFAHFEEVEARRISARTAEF